VAQRRKAQGTNVFHLKSNEPFAFAGLSDVWRRLDGSNLESFTVITTEPNDLMRRIYKLTQPGLGTYRNVSNRDKRELEC